MHASINVVRYRTNSSRQHPSAMKATFCGGIVAASFVFPSVGGEPLVSPIGPHENRIEQTTLVSTASPRRTLAPPAGAIVARSAAHSFRRATTSTMNGFRHGNGNDNDPDAEQTVLNDVGK